MAIPYPGRSRGKDRANLDELEYINPYQFFLFYFDFNDFVTKPIFILPKDAMLWSDQINIIEKFNGTLPELNVGIKDNHVAVGSVPVHVVGPHNLDVRNTTVYFNILTRDTEIYKGITHQSGGTQSTQGSGWCVLHYLLGAGLALKDRLLR